MIDFSIFLFFFNAIIKWKRSVTTFTTVNDRFTVKAYIAHGCGPYLSPESCERHGPHQEHKHHSVTSQCNVKERSGSSWVQLVVWNVDFVHKQTSCCHKCLTKWRQHYDCGSSNDCVFYSVGYVVYCTSWETIYGKMNVCIEVNGTCSWDPQNNMHTMGMIQVQITAAHHTFSVGLWRVEQLTNPLVNHESFLFMISHSIRLINQMPKHSFVSDLPYKHHTIKCASFFANIDQTTMKYENSQRHAWPISESTT